MRKTLSVLVAAVVALTFFATTAFAATTASLGANTTDGVIVQASSDLAKLFDGEKWDTLGAWGGDANFTNVVGFVNGNATQNYETDNADDDSVLSLIIDLGEVKYLDSFTIYFYQDYNVMIGTGPAMPITVSASATTESDFVKIKDFTFESDDYVMEGGASNASTSTKGVVPATFEFDSTLTTRYLRLEMPFMWNKGVSSDSSANNTDNKNHWEFISMTEIEFTEGEPVTDESTGGESTGGEETPDTGDEVVVFAVLGLFALAATVVVVKKAR